MKGRMSKEQFERKFIEERPMYKAWGEYIKSYIYDELNKLYGVDIDKILKMPINPRVKKLDSIIHKAFYRKHYDNPYEDITDKVGLRVVVMTEKQIDIVKEIISKNDLWNCSLDVDYKKEKEERPEVFAYKSVHYIVRNVNNICYQEINIISGTPCEIQIRTLEQHAFAEISHDLVYKKNQQYGSEMHRLLARSVALNEASDDLFNRVYDMVDKEKENYRRFTDYFNSIMVFPIESKKLDEELYDCIKSIVEKRNISIEDIKEFIRDVPYIFNWVQTKQQNNILYRQPEIIMLYFLADKYKNELIYSWGIYNDEEDLWPIFTDLGISYGET